jgi:hypothetical protein
VEAGRDWATGILHGDAPEIPQTERKWFRVREGGVVKIVAVFIEVSAEVIVIFSSIMVEEFGADFWNIDMPLGFVIAQTLAGWSKISTKICICFGGGTIGVKRINVGPDDAWIFLARVTLDTIQQRIKATLLQESLVLLKDVDGDSAFGTDGEGGKSIRIERGDFFPIDEMMNYFAEITRKSARPAESIDAVEERRGGKFRKILHYFDAVIFGW